MTSQSSHKARGKRIAAWLAACLIAAMVALCGCSGVSGTSAGSSSQASTSTAASTASSKAASSSASSSAAASASSASVTVTKDGSYTSKDEVAAYIHEFGRLPGNFVSKTKAKKAGWDPDTGNLDEVLPGKSIGGSTFYNDDGLLPEADGRTWKECDIDYHGGYRGAKRIVFSNDGLIYYTEDHYQTFERLY